jgi:hypothetical protein
MIGRREFLVAAAGGMAAWRPGLAAEPTLDLAAAAARLLGAASAEERTRMLFPLDHTERFQWHFVPLHDARKKVPTRKGVALDDMNPALRAMTMELLRSALSAEGFTQARAIMEREAILAELEPANAWFRRTGWYFLTFFGTPAPRGTWGWRLDGHHLAVNATVTDNVLVSATPAFMGLNPVTIRHGARKGERDVLAPSEDLARELFLMLDPAQRAIAHLPKHLPEVAARSALAPFDLPRGLAGKRLSSKQQEALLSLVRHYTGRLPTALAAAEDAKLRRAGVEELSFAYSGGSKPGERHTYCVQGPTLFLHYMNEQTDPHGNPANHIHSVCRSLGNDFAGAKPG